MCKKSVTVELSKHENGRICYCKSCKRYSVAYTNASFCFNRAELIKFVGVLMSFKEYDFCFDIMGESRAIMQTQYTNMGFSVNRNDIQILNELIQEALVLSEVYEVLY